MKGGKVTYGMIGGTTMLLLLSYVLIIVRPEFYFCHQQAAFIGTWDFIFPYLSHPGGPSELTAAFLFQFFRLPVWGGISFFLLVLCMVILFSKILNQLYRHPANLLLALLPATLMVVSVNHYNFPLSVHISLLLVLLPLPFLRKFTKAWMRAGFFSMVFLFIWYWSGISYAHVFSLLALLIIPSYRKIPDLLYLAWIIILATGCGLFAGAGTWQFFPEKLFFMSYRPGIIFYSLMASPALLILILRITGPISLSFPNRHPLLLKSLAGLGLIAFLFTAHTLAFQSDARKIAASDYFAGRGMAGKCARAVEGLENYSMAANLNFNLAHLKAGSISEHFFDFLQISGYQSLQPDFFFSAELAFTSAEYYYEIGFISEARHWAYEALVFFPYSQRALILLAKTHLVCGEYEAARSCLHLLEKGLGNRKIVKELQLLTENPGDIENHPEIASRRLQIPAGKELNPYVQGRLLELLDADPENRAAFELLMLYYLLDGQLDKFAASFSSSGIIFEELPGIYEEALLIYGETRQGAHHMMPEVSANALEQYTRFRMTQEKYKGQGNMARNTLYWEMGDTYLYYHDYILPRVVIPELAEEVYEEAPI